MRLLNTSTLKLREFYDDEIPDYAILSHTWEDGEVSFQEMEKSASAPASTVSDRLNEIKRPGISAAFESKSMHGYTKITRCCRLAAAEGWNYVWVDTCCIDKTSSAELSEAINSMFRWYEEAQVCYVYMTDVSSASPQRFQWSRWFTRGWTLQELLAPSTVVFYDKDWIEIGIRWRLRDEISRATGITYESMIRPKDSSIATKMSWASNRRTTRVEDMAYSLMGLFDINMPLLYGEGQKAFMRLQHEIMQSRDDDESIFAWRDAGLASSGMFARSPAAFADSGHIHCVRNYHAAPPVVTKTLLMLEASTPTDFGWKASLVTLNCVLRGPSNTYLAVEVKPGSSGYAVRSSPGHLVEHTSLRGMEPTEYVNDILRMSLNYTEYRSAKDSSIKKQQTVVIPEPVFYHKDLARLKKAYTLRASSLPKPSFVVQENGLTISIILHEDETPVDQLYVSRNGVKMVRIKLQSDRPIAALMYKDYAVILIASDAAPSIDVVVPMPPESLEEVVKTYLKNLRENHLEPLIGREQGADHFILPLQSGQRLCVNFRKRIIEGDNVYCVHVTID